MDAADAALKAAADVDATPKAVADVDATPKAVADVDGNGPTALVMMASSWVIAFNWPRIICNLSWDMTSWI